MQEISDTIPAKQLKCANYDKLTAEGYENVEQVIKDGDVIIGCIHPKPYRDNSTVYKSLYPEGIEVEQGVNADGFPITKIKCRSDRIPVVGDMNFSNDPTIMKKTR